LIVCDNSSDARETERRALALDGGLHNRFHTRWLVRLKELRTSSAPFLMTHFNHIAASLSRCLAARRRHGFSPRARNRRKVQSGLDSSLLVHPATITIGRSSKHSKKACAGLA
jgi:hypothetical protein